MLSVLQIVKYECISSVDVVADFYYPYRSRVVLVPLISVREKQTGIHSLNGIFTGWL
jgi:hypothetical protein